ncbi:hypothetical protein F3Y22_tig00110328pilonHSYRG00233 [Hibiscus syriacus]|uniref:Phorbol-ester/DAG-type domain-containing protein n=1 Tax=Hibiscus syriacus TaxID=106335 RepID=A0A6A3AY56_HIBSY|nr:hypothetical protein F3Y22_tig00110328pilonHSYRG00233 [Hibiscus syriacus]
MQSSMEDDLQPLYFYGHPLVLNHHPNNISEKTHCSACGDPLFSTQTSTPPPLPTLPPPPPPVTTLHPPPVRINTFPPPSVRITTFHPPPPPLPTLHPPPPPLPMLPLPPNPPPPSDETYYYFFPTSREERDDEFDPTPLPPPIPSFDPPPRRRHFGRNTFSCEECDQFHLHESCAMAPVEFSHHPLHWEHPFLLLREDPGSSCDLCLESGKHFIYRCPSCDFSLDFKCALLSHGQKFLEFKYNLHRHPLLFIEDHRDVLKKFVCSACEEPLVDSVYVCIDCRFYVHEKCAELPNVINHPCHRLHPLVLSGNSTRFCKLCQAEHRGHFYRCSPCDLDIHVGCAWPHPVIEDKSRHEHPFNLFWRQGSFICDACGTEGNNLCYICSVCYLQVHKKCTSVPPVIKISRHNHCVFHKYLKQETMVGKEECRICHHEVKMEYGCYCCLREDCNYFAHVNCATEDTDLYYIVDSENLDKLDEEPIESAITCVIEWNENGDATKIIHFSHEHCLVLEDIIEEDDKHCDGCTLSILGSFYSCLGCNFLLHKSCAELPMKKHHWFDIHLLNLESNCIFTCDICLQQCCGFVYNCDECELSFCLKCATIPDTLDHPSHEHPLFWDSKYKGRCNICGLWVYNAYRCKSCKYAVHFECITLPDIVRHKCDKHFLKLCYRDKSNDPEQHFCDVCEEMRDPNDWFYHCFTCDTSVHRRCALGKYPFVKAGITYMHEGHSHPLRFVRKKYYYSRCVICGEFCYDLALECDICDYIVHWNCMSPFSSPLDTLQWEHYHRA